MNHKTLDDLAKKIQDRIPDSLKHMPESLKHVPDNLKNVQTDIEKNMSSILQAGLAKLNLVTREEYDAQLQVLERTRHKLEKVEQRLKALEEKLKHQ